MHRENFRLTIYRKQQEEASFLYRQLLHYRKNDDPDLSWIVLNQEETRFEAYIDELSRDKDIAGNVIAESLINKTFSDVHVALCVLCRQNRMNDVAVILDSLDFTGTMASAAAGDALEFEMPGSWLESFLIPLLDSRPKTLPIVARVAASRQWDISRFLIQSACSRRLDTIENESLLDSLGRLGSEIPLHYYFASLKSESHDIRGVAALAMLRSGLHMERVRQECIREMSMGRWPCRIMGLCGNKALLPVLMEKAAEDNHPGDSLLALGLLGDPDAVTFLISRVTPDKDRDPDNSAAQALNLITGADVRAGRPEKPSALSRNRQDWERWWRRNAMDFEPGRRYRFGERYTPAVLIKSLSAEYMRPDMRQMTADELAVRYSIHGPFNSLWPVKFQRLSITRLTTFAQSSPIPFKAGEWYLGGRPDH